MVREFQCPVNVSPLIRMGRWCTLFAGIGYGSYRRNALQRHEDERRALRETRKLERENTVRADPMDTAAVDPDGPETGNRTPKTAKKAIVVVDRTADGQKDIVVADPSSPPQRKDTSISPTTAAADAEKKYAVINPPPIEHPYVWDDPLIIV